MTAVIGIIALRIVEDAHGQMNSRALGVVNRVVDIVARLVDQQSHTVPIACALGIYAAQIAVVAICIKQHCNPARIIRTQAKSRSLTQSPVIQRHQRRMVVFATQVVDVVALFIQKQRHRARHGKSLRLAGCIIAVIACVIYKQRHSKQSRRLAEGAALVDVVAIQILMYTQAQIRGKREVVALVEVIAGYIFTVG